jgi:hypothetical protein
MALIFNEGPEENAFTNLAAKVLQGPVLLGSYGSQKTVFTWSRRGFFT